MFFPLFWRGSGGNPQITSAQDRGVSWRRLVRATHKIHYFLVLPGGAAAGCRGPPLSGGHPLITSSGAPLIALPLGEGGEHGNARSHGEGTDVSSSQYGLCVCGTRCAVPFGTHKTRAQQQEGEGRALTHLRRRRVVALIRCLLSSVKYSSLLLDSYPFSRSSISTC